MIVVTIELWPKGNQDKSRPLGVLAIANDGTGTPELGNYTWTLSHAGVYFGKRKEPFKKGRLRNFPRHLSPYRLISRILKEAKET